MLALYDRYQDQEEFTRVAGPGSTILVYINAAIGGFVEILNSLQSQYIILISKLCLPI